MEKSHLHSNEGACKSMFECPICMKHQQLDKEYVVYDDDDWVISHAHNGSEILGYCYLEPKKHVENWSDFDSVPLKKMGVLIKRFEKALITELPVERVYIVTISEAIRHLHVHLIPREKGAEKRGTSLIAAATSPSNQAEQLTSQGIRNLIEKLRQHF